jgi:hypothetical protein
MSVMLITSLKDGLNLIFKGLKQSQTKALRGFIFAQDV